MDFAGRLMEYTLTKLYNERPPWLADCHARLVVAAYAILDRLLALNQARAGQGAFNRPE